MSTEKLKKVGSTCMTTAQPQTPTDKTPEKEAKKENVDLSQLAQWTLSLVEEICKTVDETTTPTTQLAVVEQPTLFVTPISQRTQEEYKYSIRRGQLIHELDLGKRKVRPQR
ncbi:hypothetical protein Hanom_Chr14g01276611 [Helianthus anomalus]